MNRAAVIGAGTMGKGIAHVFAQHGWSVALIDTVPAALDKAKQERLAAKYSAAQVHAEQPVPPVHARVVGDRRTAQARVVDENGRAAEVVGRGAYVRPDPRVADVAENQFADVS